MKFGLNCRGIISRIFLIYFHLLFPSCIFITENALTLKQANFLQPNGTGTV